MHAYIGQTVEIELHLTPEPVSVSKARHALDGLEDSVPAEVLADLGLVVSELVTNSVRHAGLGPGDFITLRVSASAGPVRVEVMDGGPGFDPARAGGPETNGTGGWGMHLIDTIADRWEVERREGSTRVWIEVDVASGAS